VSQPLISSLRTERKTNTVLDDANSLEMARLQFIFKGFLAQYVRTAGHSVVGFSKQKASRSSVRIVSV
jgi:hypothetical protein